MIKKALFIIILFGSFISCSFYKNGIKNNKVYNKLDGFEVSKYYKEQIKSYNFEPETKIYINAPAADKFDKTKPTHVIFYCLPNGNTTEQTFGKKLKEGVDWHFGIQHIGAQTRRLREIITDENIIVAYLEAEKRSWPSWRGKYPDNPVLINKIIESVMLHFSNLNTYITLSGHSGGGSFNFGYLNGVETIPDKIKRICFLDSNYAYEDEKKHGDKIVEWLKRSNDHYLCILCYDDRKVVLNGKHIVSATGGTWGRTEAMVARLKKDIELKEVPEKDCVRYRGLDGRIDIIMHTNPDTEILHTVLVGDMNGFIHAITTGTKYENKAGIFNGPLAYEKWIQED